MANPSDRIRQLLSCYCLLLFGVGTSYAQFVGGSGSGTTQLNVSNSSCSATALNPFAGGSASGSASLTLSNGTCAPAPLNAFSGGSASGFSQVSVSNSACSSAPLNAFSGGNAQGSASISVSNSSCAPAPLNAFGGGNSQGSANLGVSNSACDPAPLNAFAGGSSSGFAALTVSNSSCDPVTLNAFAGGNNGGFDHVAEIVLNQSECATLPIELLYFRADLRENKVLLTWETLTETNNDYFTVERSTDGVDFESLVREEGAGTSFRNLSYRTVDSNPLPGLSYYRLSQTDFDGTTTYSKLVLIEVKPKRMNWKLHPNPISDGETFVTFNLAIAENVSVKLHDMTGRHIAGVSWCEKEPTQLQVVLDNVPVGVYMLQVSWQSVSQQWKIVVE